MKTPRRAPDAANTLAEVLVALLLIGLFLGSVYELNAVCLRYIEASKESVTAVTAVQDRTEVLRNLAFDDLTSSSYLQNLLGTPANDSDLANRATEVVKLQAYPTSNGTRQFTRSNGAVSMTQSSPAPNLGSNLVQVDVSFTWPATFGQRSRTEQATMVVSNGQKK